MRHQPHWPSSISLSWKLSIMTNKWLTINKCVSEWAISLLPGHWEEKTDQLAVLRLNLSLLIGHFIWFNILKWRHNKEDSRVTHCGYELRFLPCIPVWEKEFFPSLISLQTQIPQSRMSYCLFNYSSAISSKGSRNSSRKWK